MLPANAESGTRQVSQEFPCNPEASLCLCVLQGCRGRECKGVSGHLGMLQCGMGAVLCRAFWWPRTLSAAGQHSGQQQSLHASISAQPCTDHLLFFLQYMHLSVRLYSIHSTRQKGIRASQNLNADLKVGFRQGDVSLSGNSGIMCFAASLDLPVSFCCPKSFFFPSPL